jgi:hypothetical protein
MLDWKKIQDLSLAAALHYMCVCVYAFASIVQDLTNLLSIWQGTTAQAAQKHPGRWCPPGDSGATCARKGAFVSKEPISLFYAQVCVVELLTFQVTEWHLLYRPQTIPFPRLAANYCMLGYTNVYLY